MQIDQMRIEICGGIAAGKTSLSRLLGEADVTVVNENFEANPFLKSFYEDPVSYAFETEVTFALQHCYDIKKAIRQDVLKICDFSVLLDLAYGDVTLKKSEHKAFISVHREILSKIGYPKALIYLKCDPIVLLSRIRDRQRVYELGITSNYLSQIINALEKRIFELNNIKIVVIDSGRVNFIDNDRTFIYSELQTYLKGITSDMINDKITILSTP